MAVIFPQGIPSTATFGDERFQVTISSTGISSGAALGSQSVSADVSASGISSGAALGSQNVSIEVSASGISSGESLGSQNISADVSVAGISSDEGFGSHEISVQSQESDSVPIRFRWTGSSSLNRQKSDDQKSTLSEIVTLRGSLIDENFREVISTVRRKVDRSVDKVIVNCKEISSSNILRVHAHLSEVTVVNLRIVSRLKR
jgi:hypothetical protein